MNEKHKRYLKIVGIIAVIVVIIALVASACHKYKDGHKEGRFGDNYGQNSMDNTLSVSGLAELNIVPDQAEAYVNIVTLYPTAKEAQAKNKEIANKVISDLKAMDIEEKNVESSNYNLYKKTEWDPKLEKSIDQGYELTHTLKVTVTDVQGVGDVIDAAINAGANGVERIVFSLTKETEKEVRDQAMIKAGEVAKQKAQTIADTLGVKLGPIKTVQESNFYYTPFDYTPNYRGAGMMKAEMAAPEPSMIAPQKVEISGSISLVYGLSQNKEGCKGFKWFSKENDESDKELEEKTTGVVDKEEPAKK